MSIYEYKTNGTCARKITVELEGKVIKKVPQEDLLDELMALIREI